MENCIGLTAPNHGSLSSSAVGHGSYVTISCDTNYTLAGKQFLQCLSGSWSETVGTCEADCPELRAPIHGSLSSSSRRNGAYVTVLCDTNYTLIGESIMKCVSGSWSETVGTCEADCHRLKAPLHGSLSSSLKAHGTCIAILCDRSYTLVGKSILQCVSGIWSETVGTCEADSLHTSKNGKQKTTIIVGVALGGTVLALVGVIIALRLYSKRKTKADRRTVFASLDETQMTAAYTGNYYEEYRNPNLSDKKLRDATLTAHCSGGAEARLNETDTEATYENLELNTRDQEDYETVNNLGNRGNDKKCVYTLDMHQEVL